MILLEKYQVRVVPSVGLLFVLGMVENLFLLLNRFKNAPAVLCDVYYIALLEQK